MVLPDRDTRASSAPQLVSFSTSGRRDSGGRAGAETTATPVSHGGLLRGGDTVTLRNGSPDTEVGFKLRSSNTRVLCAAPVKGSIPPGGTACVKVILASEPTAAPERLQFLCHAAAKPQEVFKTVFSVEPPHSGGAPTPNPTPPPSPPREVRGGVGVGGDAEAGPSRLPPYPQQGNATPPAPHADPSLFGGAMPDAAATATTSTPTTTTTAAAAAPGTPIASLPLPPPLPTNIRVYLRLRPQLPGEGGSSVGVGVGGGGGGARVRSRSFSEGVSGGAKAETPRAPWSYSAGDGWITFTPDPQRQRYRFDRLMGPGVGNAEVPRAIDTPAMLQHFLRGVNCTVLAYGQTNSGKTHTMYGRALAGGSGDATSSADGLVPHTAEKLFKEITAAHGTRQPLVTVSFFEIYNEICYDLLQPAESPAAAHPSLPTQDADGAGPCKLLQIREVSTGEFAPVGLREVRVASAEECLGAIAEGVRNRTVGTSILNSRSSRSHTVFRISLAAGRRRGGAPPAQFNFVDLAGSEAIDDSSCDAQQRRETTRINLSLTYLKKIIADLSSSPHPDSASSSASSTSARHSRAAATSPSAHSTLLQPPPAAAERGGGFSGRRGRAAEAAASTPGGARRGRSHSVGGASASSGSLRGSSPSGSSTREGSALGGGVLQRALSHQQQHVPHSPLHIVYRNSALTKVLKQALGGNAITTLLCTASLSPEHQRETKSTILFGVTAKRVKTRPEAVGRRGDGSAPHHSHSRGLCSACSRSIGGGVGCGEEPPEAVPPPADPSVLDAAERENAALRNELASVRAELLAAREASRLSQRLSTPETTRHATAPASASLPVGIAELIQKSNGMTSLSNDVLDYLSYGSPVAPVAGGGGGGDATPPLRTASPTMLYSTGDSICCCPVDPATGAPLKKQTHISLPLSSIEGVVLGRHGPRSLSFKARGVSEMLEVVCQTSTDKQAWLLAVEELCPGCDISWDAPLGGGAEGGEEQQEGVGLSAEEVAFCGRAHVLPSDYLLAKRQILVEGAAVTMADMRDLSAFDLHRTRGCVQFFASQGWLVPHTLYEVRHPAG